MASGDLFKGFPVRFSMKNMQHVKVLEKFESGSCFSDFNEQEPDAGTAGGYSDEWNGSCVKEEIIIKIFKICDESLICVTYLFCYDR